MKPLAGIITALALTWPCVGRDGAVIFTGAASGGETTVLNNGKRAFALPLANLRPEHRQAHTIGNTLFNENWVAAPASAKARDGLGPLFHARSCSGCHELDGRGRPPEPGEPMTSLLLRVSLPGTTAEGAPVPEPSYGGQLATRALAGLEPEVTAEITWRELPLTFPDGTARTLRAPSYAITQWHYGPPAEGWRLGPRVAPSVFGLGLLEAVPEEVIAKWADPDDADGDGISGRMNRVWNPATQRAELGRFGWKANTATLPQQIADALRNDMGLTSPLARTENHTAAQTAVAAFPSGNDAPDNLEISAVMLDQLTHYVRTLAPPARRQAYDKTVRDGQRHFHAIGCADCHRPTLTTGPAALPELSGHNIHPYTDLLLHDLGEGLADGRDDYLATGREWRTPPLWGLGLQQTVNGHERLLHDGRANGPEEAILWHDGEARRAREAYQALPAPEREKLLRFLRSL
jgi:CxxC motif-containing protein (DUF1111 family)